ncbi:dienelactone hydrolase family protein [Terribacillus sp. 7520-G]|uniref:dienelactone hydrolase family protein n=1 Tax=Terribacillus sp. 7520-G TaxID=2025389 RepID=UPI0013046968|nr:alpha/beta fold hydrolase [Terribacillus sp. 7520-G]
MVHNQGLPYHFFQGTNQKAPILVIYHGWAGSTAGYYELAAELKELGYTVVLPDIIHHDSRGILDNYFDGQIRQRLFWETVFQTVDEFEILLADLKVNRKDILVIGSSMGGFIASSILAKNPEIQGLVNVNGSGAFVVAEEFFRSADGRRRMTSIERSMLEAYDPINYTYSGKPVLLMHGDNDHIVDSSGQYAYYAHCSSPHITFDIYNEVNHQFTDDMVEGLKSWLSKQFGSSGE